MKSSKYPIGNRNRDLPAHGTVPEPTEPPRAPISITNITNSNGKTQI